MNHNFNTAAKLLGVGQNTLFKKLRDAGVLNKSNLPKQGFIEQKLFQVKNRTYFHPLTGYKHYGKTMVTEKGIDWLAKKFDLQLPEKPETTSEVEAVK